MIPHVNLTNFPVPEACACSECQTMCETRPCWPTPAEAQAIIDSGQGSRLMRDYWARVEGAIYIISPAIVGHENDSAPFWPTGRCTFLTDEGQCELHAAGLKPSEGVFAHHSHAGGSGLHEAVAMTWDTDEGRAVEDRWN